MTSMKPFIQASACALLLAACNLGSPIEGTERGGGTDVEGLSGILVDAGGLPVGDTRVRVLSASEPGLAKPSAVTDAALDSTLTDPAGNFSFPGLTTGVYNLEVLVARSGHMLGLFIPGIRVFDEGNTDIGKATLLPTGSLRVRIRTGEDAPVANAWCRLPGTTFATYSDAAGICDFPALPPGTFRIEVTHPAEGISHTGNLRVSSGSSTETSSTELANGNGGSAHDSYQITLNLKPPAPSPAFTVPDSLKQVLNALAGTMCDSIFSTVSPVGVPEDAPSAPDYEGVTLQRITGDVVWSGSVTARNGILTISRDFPRSVCGTATEFVEDVSLPDSGRVVEKLLLRAVYQQGIINGTTYRLFQPDHFEVTAETVGLWTFDDVASGLAPDHGPNGFHLPLPATASVVFFPDSATTAVNLGGEAAVPGQGAIVEQDATTFEARIRLETYPPATNRNGAAYLMGHISSVALLIGSDGRVQVDAQIGDDSGSTRYAFISRPGTVPLNEWVTIAAAADPETGNIHAYINGVPQQLYAWSPMSGPIAWQPRAALTIGNSPYGEAQAFPGIIDEVRLTRALVYAPGPEVVVDRDAWPAELDTLQGPEE